MVRLVGAALALVVALGACKQIIGYEDPILIDGGAGGTASTTGSTSTTTTTGTGGAPPACQAGSPCYTGPQGTVGEGLCKAGTTVCKPDGTFDTCQGEVTPVVENCASGEDQDCDGKTSQCAGVLRWVDRIGHAVATAAAVDGTGSTILAGSASTMVDGGPPGASDFLLTKYDAAGSRVLTQTFTMNSISGGLFSVAADATGSAFLTGAFTGTVDFGGGPLENSNIPQEIPFVARLDPSGKHVFSKALAPGSTGAGYAAALDPSGNMVIAGYCSGQADLGGGPVGSGGGYNAFVAKYDPQGNHLHSVAYGGSGNGRAQGLGVDANGDMVIAGPFTGTLDFGGMSLTSSGTDMFVVKLDPTFHVVYAQKVGPGVDVGNPGVMGYPGHVSVAMDAAGNAFIAGGFKGTLAIGGTMLAGGSSEGVFVAKLDPMGNPLWSKYAGNAAASYASAVAVDAPGNVVVAGPFNGTLDFGSGWSVGAGGAAVFAAKLNGMDGTPLWVRSSYSGTTSLITATVAVSAAGDVSLAGGVQGPMMFGGTQLPPPSSGSVTDLYVAAFAR